jgi:hypothetical protein
MLDVVVAGGERHGGKDGDGARGRELAHAAKHLVAAGLVDLGLEGGSHGHAASCNRTFRSVGTVQT